MPRHGRPVLRFSSKIVIASVCAVVGYTVAMFMLEYENIAHGTNIQLPADMTVSWYAFWTVELVCLASIRKSKLKNKYEYDDPDRMLGATEFAAKARAIASGVTSAVATSTSDGSPVSAGTPASVPDDPAVPDDVPDPSGVPEV